jgi:hypothetical protein
MIAGDRHAATPWRVRPRSAAVGDVATNGIAIAGSAVVGGGRA